MISDFIQVLTLSMVEGITEFLPVSSTGHILLFDNIFKSIEGDLFSHADFKMFFIFIIQLGAMLAVIKIFWSELFPFTGSIKEKKEKFNLWFKVFVAIIPACFLIKIDDKIESMFYNPFSIAVALIFYGIFLILIEIRCRKKICRINNIREITYPLALGVGIFQCLAVIPGTSRSAATIIGAMLLGMNRDVATRFSFFLAIPTIGGASLIKFLKIKVALNTLETSYIVLGALIAYIVSIFVIRKLLDYVRQHDFIYFGYYRIILGIIILCFL